MLKKIFYSLLILAIPTISFSLIEPKQFMQLCNQEDQAETANRLITILKSEQKDIRRSWLTRFNATYKSPVVYAVAIQNKPITEALIKLCKEDRIDCFQYTIDKGYSLLTLATMKNNNQLVKLLIEYDHPLQIDRKPKTSALHEASKLSNTYICKLLLNMKSFTKETNLIHVQDYKQMTPINYLIENKLSDFIINTLHIYPIDINNIILDFNNRSYLHHSVMHQMLDLTELLLQQGLDPKQKSLLEETALSLANQSKNKELKKLILSYLKDNIFKSYIEVK